MPSPMPQRDWIARRWSVIIVDGKAIIVKS